MKLGFDWLFDLPTNSNCHMPLCKSMSSRSACFDLLIELAKGSVANYVRLHEQIMSQHSRRQFFRRLLEIDIFIV